MQEISKTRAAERVGNMTYKRDPQYNEIYGVKNYKLSEEEKRYLEEEQDELEEVQCIREYMEEKN